MRRVRSVMSDSSLRSSRFSVSGRTSAKTGRAPRSAKALAVETKVKDGTMTSSPGFRSNSSPAISSACVQEVVSSALPTPCSCSSRAWHFFVKPPSPIRWLLASACSMYFDSSPSLCSRLKGMVMGARGQRGKGPRVARPARPWQPPGSPGTPRAPPSRLADPPPAEPARRGAGRPRPRQASTHPRSRAEADALGLPRTS